jgi:hypothetical protein
MGSVLFLDFVPVLADIILLLSVLPLARAILTAWQENTSSRRVVSSV